MHKPLSPLPDSMHRPSATMQGRKPLWRSGIHNPIQQRPLPPISQRAYWPTRNHPWIQMRGNPLTHRTAAATPNGNQQPNPALNAVSEQPSQVLADKLLSAAPNARQSAGTQNTEPPTSAQTASRGTGSASAVTSVAGPQAAPAGPQNAGAPMVIAPASSLASPDSRNSGAAKPEADSRTPQFLEPQNEPTGRTGESVRDISFQLSNKDQGAVQVRLSERAGELRVSVRTPDSGLTRGLREGLSDLVGRLEHNGYRTETWQPADGGRSSAGDQGHDSPAQHGSSQRQNSGEPQSGAGQRQNSQNQQQSDAQAPKWVGELESSLQRSNRPWLPSATR
jgi:hypothetical protein